MSLQVSSKDVADRVESRTVGAKEVGSPDRGNLGNVNWKVRMSPADIRPRGYRFLLRWWSAERVQVVVTIADWVRVASKARARVSVVDQINMPFMFLLALFFIIIVVWVWLRWNLGMRDTSTGGRGWE